MLFEIIHGIEQCVNIGKQVLFTKGVKLKKEGDVQG